VGPVKVEQTIAWDSFEQIQLSRYLGNLSDMIKILTRRKSRSTYL